MNRDIFLHDLKHTGFTVQRDAFDIGKINELNEFAETIRPERGHTKDKKWIGWNQVKDMENPKTDISGDKRNNDFVSSAPECFPSCESVMIKSKAY